MNNIQEILEQLERPVDVKQLTDALDFDLDDFERVNMVQPKLYLEAGRYLTWYNLERARAEVKLETREAQLSIELRNTEAKTTDKSVLASVAANAEIKTLKQKLYLAKAGEIWAKQLVEAFNQRGQVLNNISRIRAAETSSNLRAVKENSLLQTVRQEGLKMRQRIGRRSNPSLDADSA